MEEISNDILLIYISTAVFELFMQMRITKRGIILEVEPYW